MSDPSPWILGLLALLLGWGIVEFIGWAGWWALLLPPMIGLYAYITR